MKHPFCSTQHPPKQSRRQWLTNSSTGFGITALAGLMQQRAFANEPPKGIANSGDSKASDRLPASAALRAHHHPPAAKHVIFCYMSGGVSHVDSFDPKPRLAVDHGKPMPLKVERTQFNNNGLIMASPFQFARHGESGMEISSLFPHIARCADDLAVIRSMTTPVNEHAQGNFAMHTGFPFMGHPSAGAWMSYGLGSENEQLPGFVVLQSGDAVVPHGGISLYSNGYLPAQHQGSLLQADQREAIRNLLSNDIPSVQENRLQFIQALDQQFAHAIAGKSQEVVDTGDAVTIEAAIRNYETAYRMQTSVPELCDLSDETEETKELYGLNSQHRQLAAYARQCLLARRLVERGVRFIELSCLTAGIGAGNGPNPWDQHGELERGHGEMAKQVDQPIAALLTDLKRLGLLQDTLVVWAGEFGRTPFSQGSNGRDHNPLGFSVWLAGGGVRGGTIYGATDEFGYHAVENRCTIYDLWATVLHQMGVDHTRLTYRYGGRDFRLTDVHGDVIEAILA
jgi:hypothetical protein